MARNIEIKARLKDPADMRRRVAELCACAPQRIEQEDIFYACPTGKLKLRILAPDQGELIHYQRPTAPEPRPSDYRIAVTREPEAMHALLTGALGEWGRVRKMRILYRVGRTRIHLDEVEGLGHFLEIEVVLGDGETRARGEATAAELMTRLGIRDADLVAESYVDLLARAATTR